MSNVLSKAWTDMVQPLLRRPKRFQVAALCQREKDGQKEVLLITSRGTGRWILPKGWPMDGMTASDAALQEAWEEAGVKDGKVAANSVGSFEFEKELDTGGVATCTTKVFPVQVKLLEDEFPEASERTRKWVSPQEASKMVNEPGLKKLLDAL